MPGERLGQSLALVGAALLFGPGQQEQTTVESDGGILIGKTIAYRKAGGWALK
ncbi:hypothetical protein [Streptacidiphilus sp. EB129]|uniref:hypothetical protein n=1 Tax=Streptacidiphilus sp. EB129 TaxID=3156262 RepID=UPI0035162A43